MKLEDKIIGLGFETETEMHDWIRQECENESVVVISNIHEPNEKTEDEYFEIGLSNKVITCWIARGKSGRIYVVERIVMND